MSLTSEEINSQPELWRRVLDVPTDALPKDGEAIAVIGCGTSWFIAQAYTVARERQGKGLSDAFTATEFPWDRHYDRVVCLSRSGTTTEIIDILHGLKDRGVPNVLITAVGNGPATPYADVEVVLDFADEESVVQTRQMLRLFWTSPMKNPLSRPVLQPLLLHTSVTAWVTISLQPRMTHSAPSSSKSPSVGLMPTRSPSWAPRGPLAWPTKRA